MTREQRVLALRRRGASYQDIALQLGTTESRAVVLVRQAEVLHLGNTPEWFYRRERFKHEQCRNRKEGRL